jgi:hypothetical protein
MLTINLLADPHIPTFPVACAYMRIRRLSGGGNASVTVGGEATTSNAYGSLVVPVSGTGPGTNISSIGARKTIVVEGAYGGSLIVEGALDGGILYDPVITCDTKGSGVYVLDGVWQYMRVRRIGSLEGSPSVTVGGHPVGGGGSGGINSQILKFSGEQTIPGPNGVVPDPLIAYFADASPDYTWWSWYYALPAAGVLSSFRVDVSYNDCDGPTTFIVVNGIIPTGQSLVVPAGTTGRFVTAGASAAFGVNDQLTLMASTTGDSGSHFLDFTAMALFTIS